MEDRIRENIKVVEEFVDDEVAKVDENDDICYREDGN